MEKTIISVVLADNSEDFLRLLSERIGQEEDMLVAEVARNGEEAMAAVRRFLPTVLVTDLLLQRLDGVSLLRELRTGGKMPRTIVASAFFNDITARELIALGVSYCYMKPCRIEELITRIRECALAQPYPPSASGRWDEEIRAALMHFGVIPKHLGYRFLWEAIRRNLEDKDALTGVTKILYPELAKYFETNAGCIERCMRNAIKAAWSKPENVETREAYFGAFTLGLQEEKPPSNSEFIALIREYILMRRGRNDWAL